MSPLVLPILAVGAGMISFSSPCCLPLIPGYLSYVSALPVSELGERESRAVTLRASLLFVGGFTVVFTALGASFGLVGSALRDHRWVMLQMAGVGIILMALATLGVLRIPFLYRERRMDLARVPRGPGAAFPFGMAFALGWVPCSGPVLATITATAAATSTPAWGALLFALYSIGLGLPFIALALAYDRGRTSMNWLRRHGQRVEQVAGVMMLGVGVLFVSGEWESFFTPLQRWFARVGWPPV